MPIRLPAGLLLAFITGLRRRVGEVGLHTGGDQATLDSFRQVVGDLVGQLTQRETAGSGGARIDYHHFAGQVRAVAPDPVSGPHGIGVAATDQRREPGDCLEGGRPAGAVGRDSTVALELPDRDLGLSPESPVGAPDLEAELEESAL